MSWTEVEVGYLIEEVRARECLWRIKCKDYSNRFVKQRAWEAVNAEMLKIRCDLTWEACKRKWTVLRTSFMAENRKVVSSSKSGCGSDEVYNPSVHYYSKMLFLRDQLEPRRGFSNLSQDPSSGTHPQQLYNPAVDTVSTVSQESSGAFMSDVMNTGEDRPVSPPLVVLPTTPFVLREFGDPNRNTPTSSISSDGPVQRAASQTPGSSIRKRTGKKKDEPSMGVEGLISLAATSISEVRQQRAERLEQQQENRPTANNDDVGAFCRFLEARLRHLPRRQLSSVYTDLMGVVSRAFEQVDENETVES